MWQRDSEEDFNLAVEALKEGKLVAFPTETVYGLGANGLDEVACKNIYLAKGRPSDNPLILHIAEKKALYDLARVVPKKALALAKAFWPGPLTMVLLKKAHIPKAVTGGLDTVAIRLPNSPLALALIKRAGFPLAAPSANKSGKPSPTSASHVAEDFKDEIAGIIDGGTTSVGVESTIVDLSNEPPVILRPGGITKEMIEAVIGPVLMHSGEVGDTTPKAPGMKYRHYAPSMPVYLVGEDDFDALRASLKDKEGIGLVLSEEGLEQFKGLTFQSFSLGKKADTKVALQRLFGHLRKADRLGLKCLYLESYEKEGLGLTFMNRAEKLALGSFKEVEQ